MGVTPVNIEETMDQERKAPSEFSWKLEERRLLREWVALREQSKLTQSELAEKVGSHQQLIALLECGDVDTSLGSFCRLLDALGYKLEIVKQ